MIRLKSNQESIQPVLGNIIFIPLRYKSHQKVYRLISASMSSKSCMKSPYDSTKKIPFRSIYKTDAFNFSYLLNQFFGAFSIIGIEHKLKEIDDDGSNRFDVDDLTLVLKNTKLRLSKIDVVFDNTEKILLINPLGELMCLEITSIKSLFKLCLASHLNYVIPNAFSNFNLIPNCHKLNQSGLDLCINYEDLKTSVKNDLTRGEILNSSQIVKIQIVLIKKINQSYQEFIEIIEQQNSENNNKCDLMSDIQVVKDLFSLLQSIIEIYIVLGNLFSLVDVTLENDTNIRFVLDLYTSIDLINVIGSSISKEFYGSFIKFHQLISSSISYESLILNTFETICIFRKYSDTFQYLLHALKCINKKINSIELSVYFNVSNAFCESLKELNTAMIAQLSLSQAQDCIDILINDILVEDWKSHNAFRRGKNISFGIKYIVFKINSLVYANSENCHDNSLFKDYFCLFLNQLHNQLIEIYLTIHPSRTRHEQIIKDCKYYLISIFNLKFLLDSRNVQIDDNFYGSIYASLIIIIYILDSPVDNIQKYCNLNRIFTVSDETNSHFVLEEKLTHFGDIDDILFTLDPTSNNTMKLSEYFDKPMIVSNSLLDYFSNSDFFYFFLKKFNENNAYAYKIKFEELKYIIISESYFFSNYKSISASFLERLIRLRYEMIEVEVDFPGLSVKDLENKNTFNTILNSLFSL